MPTTPQARSTAQKLAIFRRCFSGLPDVYGTYEMSTGRAYQVKQPVTDSVLLAHLLGRQPYGVYLLIHDRTRALAVDLDVHDPVPAMEYWSAARHYGLSTYIERSKSKGHHVWMFFNDAGVRAAKARLIARHLLAEIDRPDTEVFPKHDVLGQHAVYGNFVYAPLWGSLVPQGRTVFVYPHEPARAYPDQWEVLERVERIPETSLDDIIAINELGQKVPSAPAPPVVKPANHLSAFGLPVCAQRMLAQGVRENQRVACFRLAVHLKRVGIPADLAVATLLVWATKNQPVEGKRIITAEEIERQVAAAYQRGYRSCGCEDAAVGAFCSPACPVRQVRHGALGSLPVETAAGDHSITRGGAVHVSYRDEHVSLSESEMEEHTMSEQSRQRPIKEFRAGPVKIAIWQNDAEQNGQHVIRHSVRIGKRYFDRQQNSWQDSEYFFVNDLPRLRLLVEKAFEFIALRESDPDAADAPDGSTVEAR